MSKHLANERAKFAFDKVSDMRKNSTKDFPTYRSLVRSLPAMILSNGYGAAMAFLYSKEGDRKLYDHLFEWLKEQELCPQKQNSLMEYISCSNQDIYRLLESETMALLEWLKRFAEGMDLK